MKKLVLASIVPILVLLMPIEMIPIVNITVVEQRLLAIFVMAIFYWVMEPIPIFATSVLIIGLELFTISTKGLIWLRAGKGTDGFGTLVNYASIMKTFASPIILLFIGGFFLALAATKYKLDINLARVLLKPFGTKPSMVMLGLMMITALFSMFMSNTATTAMMLALLAPVLALFKKDDPGAVAFALSIPFAANIGGIGTPIGTPPNAIAMKYLTGDIAISFGEWMGFAFPYVIVMLAVVWFLLLFLFPPKEKSIELKIDSTFDMSWQAKTVYVTFAVTILLWLTGKIHGMSSYVVAMVPVVIFVATGIVNKKDLQTLSWDVLWLISGGIALGLALTKTGLSLHMVQSIPFDTFPPMVILLLGSILCLLMSTFISNTATANLILPIMAALGASLTTLEPVGGQQGLIIVCTFACSLAMAMPISTPPNAMAYATGKIKQVDMMKGGAIVSAIGLTAAYVLTFVLKSVGFFG